MEIKSLGKVKALGVTKDEEQECCVLTTVYQGYSALLYPVTSIPGSSVAKNLPANVGDVGSIPSLGRSLEKEMAITPVFFSYCSWDSQGKNTELVCHSLLQMTITSSNVGKNPFKEME